MGAIRPLGAIRRMGGRAVVAGGHDWLSSDPLSDDEVTCRDAATRRYAVGLPQRGQRSLSDRDRAWIEQRLRRLVWETGAAMLGVAAVMAGAWGLAPHVSWLAVPLRGSLGLGLVALGGVGLLVCLGARGWWRRLALVGAGLLALALVSGRWAPALAQPPWLVAELLVGTTVLGLSRLGLALAHRLRIVRRMPRIRADLAAGVVERFEAPLPRGPLEDVLARLRDAGYLERHASVRLEVLPRSGVVMRSHGRRIERWETADVIDVAPAQPHALRVDLPREVAPAEPDPRVSLKRRSLTPEERAELQRHIARLRRRWWPVAAFAVAVVGLVAWDLRTATPDEALPLDGATLGWLAMLGLVVVGHVRRELAARKLEHDRRLRWVVTVHQDTSDPGRDPPSLEVLPISQLAWTERAAPAGWRLSRL